MHYLPFASISIPFTCTNILRYLEWKPYRSLAPSSSTTTLSAEKHIPLRRSWFEEYYPLEALELNSPRECVFEKMKEPVPGAISKQHTVCMFLRSPSLRDERQYNAAAGSINVNIQPYLDIMPLTQRARLCPLYPGAWIKSDRRVSTKYLFLRVLLQLQQYPPLTRRTLTLLVVFCG